MQRKSLSQIMLELRTLSGMANDLGVGEVDWMVPRSDLSDPDQELLMRLAMPEENEAEKAAAKHTVKGKIESLAERLEGLVDFIDKEDYQAATLAMAKVHEDLGALLKEMKKRTADKKIDDKEKEAEEKAQQQAMQGAEGGEEQTPAQSEQPTSRRNGEVEQGATVPQKPVARESVIIVGGEVISEALNGDPFGFGENFMEEIRARSGLRKKK